MEQNNQEPETDMTAAEYFNGEGSPLTLDKILQPQERDFLLEHIELYAQGKVNQFKISQSHPAPVGGEEWISVEDRLPEVDESVLCYFKKSRRIDVCKYTEVFKMEFVENAICQTENITHWQPLPPKP